VGRDAHLPNFNTPLIYVKINETNAIFFKKKVLYICG
jgi:hypothetical protein